ncbi:MAG: SAM-dependent chlorinase/fluorinase [Acidobacteriota bacterium]
MTAITLLTDFGETDYYVAAVKGVLLQRAPTARQIDLGHRLAPGDVAGASWMLSAASRWYPAGTVHLAVVDPGVGSTRRMLAARCDEQLYVAPDNGLLSDVLARSGRTTLVAADRPDLYLDGAAEGGFSSAGRTFAGRDRFAPLAAALAGGEPLTALGPEIDDPIHLERPAPWHEGEIGAAGTSLHGYIVHCDRFGNLVSDIPTAWAGQRACESLVEGHRTEVRADHYAALAADQPALLPGSLGTLELALRDRSLAASWGVPRGVPLLIHLR